MAKFINMPKMGNTVTSVIFSEWFVKEGDSFKEGDKLFSYETDKTTTEEEAKEAGSVLKLLVKPDDEVPVFAPVMIIGQKGDDISALLKEINYQETDQSAIKDSQVAKPVSEEVAKDSQAPNPEVENTFIKEEKVAQKQPIASSSTTGGGISPRARQMLHRSGIPFETIKQGSGPDGRIISQDVTQAMDLKNLNPQHVTASITNPNPSLSKINEILQFINNKGDEDYVYPSMRAAIAKGMIKSQKQSAFTTLTMTIDAAKLLETRNQIKINVKNGGPNISINDLIIFAVSRVLPKYKKTMNAHVEDTRATLHNHANIAVAVDTPNGLIVPVIKEANLKSLVDISKEAKTVIDSVRKGEYRRVDLSSGTFTISNVGGMGIEVFTPVLNAGQAAILGVGTTILRPRQNKQGLVEFYNAMILSLTIDHRLADGADGARFLNDLKLILENIDLIM